MRGQIKFCQFKKSVYLCSRNNTETTTPKHTHNENNTTANKPQSRGNEKEKK